MASAHHHTSHLHSSTSHPSLHQINLAEDEKEHASSSSSPYSSSSSSSSSSSGPHVSLPHPLPTSSSLFLNNPPFYQTDMNGNMMTNNKENWTGGFVRWIDIDGLCNSASFFLVAFSSCFCLFYLVLSGHSDAVYQILTDFFQLHER
jgi:hypothetical protein